MVGEAEDLHVFEARPLDEEGNEFNFFVSEAEPSLGGDEDRPRYRGEGGLGEATDHAIDALSYLARTSKPIVTTYSTPTMNLVRRYYPNLANLNSVDFSQFSPGKARLSPGIAHRNTC